LDTVFFALTAILIVGTLFAAIAKFFKQPLIVSYIITGIVLKIIFPAIFDANFAQFGEIGVALLLFIVGMKLNPKFMKDLGKFSLIAGFGQIAFSFILSVGLAKFLFGFCCEEVFFIAVAMCFSSTIILIKILTDQKQIEKLYAKLTTGILIFQDLAAVVVIFILSNISNGNLANNLLRVGWENATKGFLFLSVIYLIYTTVLPRVVKFFSTNQELLFLFTMTWCFAWSAVAYLLGFSIEIGALLAGVALSDIPFHYEMEVKIRRIRDFFLIIFFVSLGSYVNLNQLINHPNALYHISSLTILALLINPFIIFQLLKHTKLTFRTIFLTALNFSQMSEFAFIILGLGIKNGILNNDYVLQILTIVAIITMTISSYLITFNEQILQWKWVQKWGKKHNHKHIKHTLHLFNKDEKMMKKISKKKYEHIFFGYNGTNHSLIKKFQNKLHKILIVDYNPRIIHKLCNKKLQCLYADADDEEILDEIKHPGIKTIVSILENTDANFKVVRTFSKIRPKPVIIVSAHDPEDALKLYKMGADFVVIPRLISSDVIAQIIKDENKRKDIKHKIKEFRQAQMKSLKEIKSF